jgi:hypothetical protein
MTATTFDRIATAQKRHIVRDMFVGIALALGVIGGATSFASSAKSLAQPATLTAAPAATQSQVAQSDETECFVAFGNESQAC